MAFSQVQGCHAPFFYYPLNLTKCSHNLTMKGQPLQRRVATACHHGGDGKVACNLPISSRLRFPSLSRRIIERDKQWYSIAVQLRSPSPSLSQAVDSHVFRDATSMGVVALCRSHGSACLWSTGAPVRGHQQKHAGHWQYRS